MSARTPDKINQIIEAVCESPKLSVRKHAKFLDMSGRFLKARVFSVNYEEIEDLRTSFGKKLRRFTFKRCAKYEQTSKIVSKLA